MFGLRLRRPSIVDTRARTRLLSEEKSDVGGDQVKLFDLDLENVKALAEAASLFAMEGVVNACWELNNRAVHIVGDERAASGVEDS